MTDWKHKKIGKFDTYPQGVVSQERFAHVLVAEHGAVELEPIEAYKKIFRLGEGYIQRAGEYSQKPEPIKGNPIAYYIEHKGDKSGHFRIMLEDRFDHDLKILQKAHFAILNGLTYYGRKNVSEHQDRCFALIFDIDGVLDVTLPRLFHMADVGLIPMPNLVALSGHGLHLYYIFDEPLQLYPETKVQLKSLKYELTRKLWYDRLSVDEHVQQQGINQGFRPIGGRTKTGKRVRVFETRQQKWTIEALNGFVDADHQVEPQKVYKTPKVSIEMAKKKWPEWYEEVVEESQPRRRWKTEEKVHGDNPHALYDWWIRKVKDGASYHHRYFCVMCMYIYGVKNGISKEKVTQDALDLLPFFNGISEEAVQDPFTEDDIKSASDCYDLRFATFPIKDIEKVSDIPIRKNKRNNRGRATHVKVMTAVRDALYPDGEWRNKKGAPTKKEAVETYAIKHPGASPTQAARDLGISRPTVYKWWPKS